MYYTLKLPFQHACAKDMQIGSVYSTVISVSKTPKLLPQLEAVACFVELPETPRLDFKHKSM